MHNLTCLLVVFLVSCAAVVPGLQDSGAWCLEKGQRALPEPEQARTDIGVWPVDPGRMGEALAALQDSSVIELSSDRATALLAAGAALSEGRYYLARAGIYAPMEADYSRIVELTRTARFDLHWFADSGEVGIVTLQATPPRGSVARNIAVIVRAGLPIRRAFAACYAVR